jgi:hypothetical protein
MSKVCGRKPLGEKVSPAAQSLPPAPVGQRRNFRYQTPARVKIDFVAALQEFVCRPAKRSL